MVFLLQDCIFYGSIRNLFLFGGVIYAPHETPFQGRAKWWLETAEGQKKLQGFQHLP